METLNYFRPLYLPLRAVVTIGNFTMSSHLAAQANTSTLRFITEDCILFLSDKSPPKNGTPSSSPVDLKRDYVSVVDLGLFELSLKTNDKVGAHICIYVLPTGCGIQRLLCLCRTSRFDKNTNVIPRFIFCIALAVCSDRESQYIETFIGQLRNF